MAIRSTYSSALNFSALQDYFRACANDPTTKAVMVLLADQPIDVDALNTVLRDAPIAVFGGVFPGVVFENRVYDAGMVLVELPFEVSFIEGEIASAVPALPELPKCDGNPLTAFLFVDSLAENKGKLVDALYNEYGTQLKYIGGGAGSLSFTTTPCVLSNRGLRSDAFVMGLTSAPVSLGVAHGWHPISEIMKVTESKGRELISINWEPAFKVYREVVETHSGKSFQETDFFDLAKSYPFGKPLVQAEYVVRDPFGTDNTSIFLVDAIEPGEFVYIMHGAKESLLAGARKATTIARSGEGPTASATFCIDCISRRLFMGDDFNEELATVSPESEAIGALTIGELANKGNSYLELYNKTICVARL